MRLDIAALCLAAHAHAGLDVDAECARLDELARRCPTASFDGLRTYLFRTLGFRGNSRDYGDPGELVPRLGDRTPARHSHLARGRDDGSRAPDRGAGARRWDAGSLPRDGRDAWRCLVRSVSRRCRVRPRGLPPTVRACPRERTRFLARVARSHRPACDRRAHARQPRERPARVRSHGDLVAVHICTWRCPTFLPTSASDSRPRNERCGRVGTREAGRRP